MTCHMLDLQILTNMQRQGPGILLEPSDLFNMCLYSSLIVKNTESSLSAISPVSLMFTVPTLHVQEHKYMVKHYMSDNVITFTLHYTWNDTNSCTLRVE